MDGISKMSDEQMVYERIKEAIYKRRLAPGSALKEQNLCDALGAGRTPVRGALRKLADEGFVEIIANRGAFVTQVDRNQVRQIFDIRIELEILALRMGICNFSEEDAVALNAMIVREEEAFAQRDLKKYLEINGEFHMHLVSKSQNEFLLELFQQVYQKLLIYLVLYDNFYLPMNKRVYSISNNKKIVSALEKKDLKKLEKMIRSQCLKTVETLNFDTIAGANVETAFAK